MATIATIPRSQIERIQLYINNERLTLSAIKAQTGADFAINGTLYDMAKWLPVMHYRADGVTHSSDQYDTYHGYGWDAGNDIRVVMSRSKNGVRNYICGTDLIVDGKPCDPLYYDPAAGGVRGRTAIALKGDNLILYCVGDGQVGRCSPEELRGELVALGVDSAVMLDGGLSSQCIFPSASVTSSRIVENVILIYLTPKEVQPTMPNYDCTVFLDPGHGGSTGLLRDCSNGSPDGTYKEHVFSLDLAQRIKKLLQEQGIRVVMSRETDMYVALTKRAALANRAKATLFLSIHTNAAANGGWADPSGLVAYTYAEGGKRDELAKAILSSVKAAGVKTFGQELYHAKFVVLRDTDMPACLVEYGFHTNKNDVALLKDNAYRDKLALATAKAIVVDYLKKTWIESSSPAEKKYTVEIATFSNRAAAQAVVDKLKEIGVTAKITEKE